jgi:type IV pilus biogenesis protein CpaD/CtpE
MTMLETFTALVSGATDAGDRIYPQVAPDGVARPFIVYQRINTNTENVLSGSSGLKNTRLQVDVFATTYSQAQQIALAIENLMASWSTPNVSIVSQDIFEDEVKLHRVMTDYSIWHDN